MTITPLYKKANYSLCDKTLVGHCRSCHVHEYLRLATYHLLNNSTIHQVTTVQYALSSASGGSRCIRTKKAIPYVTGGDLVRQLNIVRFMKRLLLMSTTTSQSFFIHFAILCLVSAANQIFSSNGKRESCNINGQSSKMYNEYFALYVLEYY